MNKRIRFGILTGGAERVIERIPRTDGPLRRNPRQIRLSAGLLPSSNRGCPQILWIKVCVSCKFGR
jgi:hypothetical protein